MKIKYDGKSYELGFNRESVKKLESLGFELDKVDAMPQTMIPLFFYGSFMKEHTGIKRKLVDEMWSKMPRKDKVIEVLMESYTDTLNTLMDNYQGDDAVEIEMGE